MNEVIELEKAKLQDCAIFFVAIDSSRVPLRNFFNDWFHKVWGQKLGFHFTYCRMLQKGLLSSFFVIIKPKRKLSIIFFGGLVPMNLGQYPGPLKLRKMKF